MSTENPAYRPSDSVRQLPKANLTKEAFENMKTQIAWYWLDTVIAWLRDLNGIKSSNADNGFLMIWLYQRALWLINGNNDLACDCRFWPATFDALKKVQGWILGCRWWEIDGLPGPKTTKKLIEALEKFRNKSFTIEELLPNLRSVRIASADFSHVGNNHNDSVVGIWLTNIDATGTKNYWINIPAIDIAQGKKTTLSNVVVNWILYSSITITPGKIDSNWELELTIDAQKNEKYPWKYFLYKSAEIFDAMISDNPILNSRLQRDSTWSLRWIDTKDDDFSLVIRNDWTVDYGVQRVGWLSEPSNEKFFSIYNSSLSEFENDLLNRLKTIVVWQKSKWSN